MIRTERKKNYLLYENKTKGITGVMNCAQTTNKYVIYNFELE